MANRWYAVNTRPNAERLALTNLDRQGFAAFLPLRTRTVRHARQFRTSRAPLFPGYLFVELDLARDRWRSVNGTLGVVSLVSAGKEPVPVPGGLVECLLSMSSPDGVVTFAHQLQPGSKVKVLLGPFAEQLGTLESLTDRGRVEVLLEMMGTSVRVRSRMEDLAPA